MRTFEVPDLERAFEKVSYTLRADARVDDLERYVLTVECRTIFNRAHLDFDKIRGWMFGRPYDLILMGVSVTIPSDVVVQREFEYAAIPVKADLRHPVLVLRKRRVSYA